MNFIERIEQFSQRQDLTAMISGDESLSFADLWTYSDRLAAYLKLNCRKHEPLLVYGHKRPLMLVCFLACVKSGHAYCPIDISFPLLRISDVCSIVDPEFVLATETIEVEQPVLAVSDLMAICQDQRLDHQIDTMDWVSHDDTFYIIFTSGSTGKPKGVEISLGNLSAFAAWITDLSGLALEGQRILNQAPFSFDLSVMDITLALTNGGCLWAISADIAKDYRRLMAALEQSQVKVWVSTPSFADVCLAAQEFTETLLPKLCLFLFCGETLSHQTAQRLHERFPASRIVNTYGPTESTVAISAVDIDEACLALYDPLPIGVEKPGTQVWIDPTADDPEQGELIILGDTLSKGYYRNAEKTAQNFFVTDTGERAYRTGDLGYRRNGLLFFQHRKDFQIKLHGYRIELGDIERNLLAIDHVVQAAVLAKIQNQTITALVAFVDFDQPIANRLALVNALKHELKDRLPAYMVPRNFVFLDHFPTTANGKIDRNRLQEMIP